MTPSGDAPSEKSGRIKYADILPPEESSETTTESEKRLPSTLRHRNR